MNPGKGVESLSHTELRCAGTGNPGKGVESLQRKILFGHPVRNPGKGVERASEVLSSVDEDLLNSKESRKGS